MIFSEENPEPLKQRIQYVDFMTARKIARKLGLKTQAQWKKYCKGQIKNLPPRLMTIPVNPDFHYWNSGWKS